MRNEFLSLRSHEKERLVATILKDWPVKKIARRLEISERTVRRWLNPERARTERRLYRQRKKLETLLAAKLTQDQL